MSIAGLIGRIKNFAGRIRQNYQFKVQDRLIKQVTPFRSLPADVVDRLQPKSQLSVPQINYRKHPAFVKVSAACPPLPEKIQQEMQGLTSEIGKLVAYAHEGSLQPNELVGWSQEVLRLTAGLRSTYHPATDRILPKVIFSKSLEYATGQILYNGYITAFRTNAKQRCDKDRLDQLKSNGYSIFNLSTKLRTELTRITPAILARMHQKIAGGIVGRTAESVATNSPLGHLIQNLVREYNIAELFSQFKGVDTEYWGTGIELTTAEHRWWKGCYDSDGLSQSSTSYLHFDHSDFSPKIMLYLTDVDLQKGPTRFVSGSHNWQRDEFLFQFHKGLDRVSAQMVLPVDTRYYRPFYQSNEMRSILMGLPDRFVGTSHFGDDLLEGTRESNQVLQNEIALISTEGDFVAFDGGRGLHRGSLVESGERLAAQLIFMPKRHKEANRFASIMLKTDFDITA